VREFGGDGGEVYAEDGAVGEEQGSKVLFGDLIHKIRHITRTPRPRDSHSTPDS
jgi:hypothetical protein